MAPIGVFDIVNSVLLLLLVILLVVVVLRLYANSEIREQMRDQIGALKLRVDVLEKIHDTDDGGRC
jgi:hypothetical protein